MSPCAVGGHLHGVLGPLIPLFVHAAAAECPKCPREAQRQGNTSHQTPRPLALRPCLGSPFLPVVCRAGELPRWMWDRSGWRCVETTEGTLLCAPLCFWSAALLVCAWPPLLQGFSHSLSPILLQSLSRTTTFPPLAIHPQVLLVARPRSSIALVQTVDFGLISSVYFHCIYC